MVKIHLERVRAKKVKLRNWEEIHLRAGNRKNSDTPPISLSLRSPPGTVSPKYKSSLNLPTPVGARLQRQDGRDHNLSRAATKTRDENVFNSLENKVDIHSNLGVGCGLLNKKRRQEQSQIRVPTRLLEYFLYKGMASWYQKTSLQ